jgi:hypothetical protein
VVSSAISSTGHAPVDSAQLAGAVADLAMRSSQLESGFLTMQQMMGQMMLAQHAHSTQVANSLARLSALYEAAVGAPIPSYSEEYDEGGAGVDGGGEMAGPDGRGVDASNTVGPGGAVGQDPPPLPPLPGASAGLAPAPGPAVPSGPVADASRGNAGGTAGIQPRVVSFPSAAGGAVPGAVSPHFARGVAGGLVTPPAHARRVGIPGTAAAVASATPDSIHSFSSWQEPRTIASSVHAGAVVSAANVPFLTDHSAGAVAKWADAVEPLVMRGAIPDLTAHVSEKVLLRLRVRGAFFVPGAETFLTMSPAEQLKELRQRLIGQNPVSELSQIKRQPSATSAEVRLRGEDFIVNLLDWERKHANIPDRSSRALAYFKSQYPAAFRDAFPEFALEIYRNYAAAHGVELSGQVPFNLEVASIAFSFPQYSRASESDKEHVWSLAITRPGGAGTAAGAPAPAASSGAASSASASGTRGGKHVGGGTSKGGGPSSGSAPRSTFRGSPPPGFTPEQLTFLRSLAAQGLVSLPGSSGGAVAGKAAPTAPAQPSGRGGRGGGGAGRGGGGAGRGGGRGGHSGSGRRSDSGGDPHHSS